MRQSLRLAQQSLNPRLGLHHRARLRRDPTKPLLRSVCHTACSDCGRKMPKQKRNCGRKVGVVSLSRNCSEITAHAHSHKHTHTHNPARVHAHAQAHTHTHTRTHNHRHAHTSTLTITFAIAIARARAVRVSAFFARAIFAPLPPRLPAPGHAPRPGSRRSEAIN